MREGGGLPIVATHPEPTPPIAMTAPGRLLLVPVLSLASASVLVAQPPAGEVQRRQLSLEVVVVGEESWQHNGSWEKGKIDQRFALTTRLYSDGGRSAVNPLDPRSTQAAQQQGQAVRDAAAAAQRRQALDAGIKMPSAEAQQQLNAAIARAYQQCAGNETCIRDAVMATAPQLLATPPGISVAPGIELGGAAQGSDAAEIYQPWLSEDGCPGSFTARRNDASEGQLTDVGGPRARQQRVQLDEGGARTGLCHRYAMTVVDTRTPQLFLKSFALPELRARRTSTGIHGVQTVEAMPPQIHQWVNAQLRGIPLSGERTATLDLTQPVVVAPTKNYAGRATVTLRWRFA